MFSSLVKYYEGQFLHLPVSVIIFYFKTPLFFYLKSVCPPFGSFVVFFNRPLKGRKGGNGSGFARAIKGFPFFGFFRAKKRLAAKAQCPYLLSLFPCKGGQVGAYGSFFISLVSFIEFGSFKFQARKLCFRFVVVAPA